MLKDIQTARLSGERAFQREGPMAANDLVGAIAVLSHGTIAQPWHIAKSL